MKRQETEFSSQQQRPPQPHGRSDVGQFVELEDALVARDTTAAIAPVAATAAVDAPGLGVRRWVQTAVPSHVAKPTQQTSHVDLFSSATCSFLPAFLFPSPQPAAVSQYPLLRQRWLHRGTTAATTGARESRRLPTGLVHHDDMLLHASHDIRECERPARVEWAYHHIRELGLVDKCVTVPCTEIADFRLLAVHDQAHIDRIDSTGFYGAANIATAARGDLFFSPGTPRAARIAAGGTVEATLQVCRGQLANALCLVRPPGHHCSSTQPSGFCFFNNVAVAARAALAEVDAIQRVMIIDWDVHHGNGTEAIFYDNPNVLFVSIHQHHNGPGHILHRPPGIPGNASLHPPRHAHPPCEPSTRNDKSREKVLCTAEELLATFDTPEAASGDRSTVPDGLLEEATAEELLEALDDVPPDNTAALDPHETPIDQPKPAEAGAERNEAAPQRATRERRAIGAAALSLSEDDALRFFAGLGADVGGQIGAAASSTSASDLTSSEGLSQSIDSSDGEWLSGGVPSAVDAPLFYPGTGMADRIGEGIALGRNINIPLPCTGLGDVEYLTIIDRLVVPIGQEFAPDVVLISCGFDCLEDDTLGSMRVTPTGMYLMTKAIVELVCPRTVAVLEGGYNLRNVALGTEAVLRALLEQSIGMTEATATSTGLYQQTEDLIRDVTKIHAPYWKCLRPENH